MNGEALPSIKNRLYPGIVTSKNFTDSTNISVLPAHTASIHPVSGGAAKPGDMKEDDMPGMKVDDAPTKEEVTSHKTMRECSYTGKGICSLHGPWAKLRWKPKLKKVTDQEGVTKLVKLKERKYFYVCNLGPSGRGALRQTSISGFLTPPRVRREEYSNVGDATLLGDRTTTTVGQESIAVVQYDGAGIKKNDEDC